MKNWLSFLGVAGRRKDRGAVIAMVAITIIVVVSLAALAIDISHLMVVKNELQNAADAGALRGATVLYVDDGTAINTDANQEAFDAARANAALSTAGAVAVDVNWSSGTNTGDVVRGHWSFSQYDCDRNHDTECSDSCGDALIRKGCFFRNDSTVPVSLWNVSTEVLDKDPDFINAVKVVARRDATRASSFFARIFGYDDFALTADAVGYIGFAGTLRPTEAEQPIAICKQMITDPSGNYSCNTGRMLNSSGGTPTNTAAWTNFSQPCVTASTPTVKPLVCGDGNPDPIYYGQGIGTTNGEVTPAYKDVRSCWMNNPDLAKDSRGYPREKWSLTLPVIDCPTAAISNCADVVGAVTVDVVWIKEPNSDPSWLDIPVQMEDWVCSGWDAAGRPSNFRTSELFTETERRQCWRDFATHFNLKTWDNTSAGDLDHSELLSTLVFLPSCQPHAPAGITGGENFGVLSEIPVLVE